jgi:hypothetical protein
MPSSSALLAFIAMIIKVESVTENPGDISQTTWCSIPEESHLHASRRKNLKSRQLVCE